MKTLSCKECGEQVANTNNVLARHVRSLHDMEWPDYIVKHELGGKHPECGCGCGDQLPWRKGGFGRFVKGHDNQGDQNPMAIKKASKEQALQQIQQMDTGNGWLPNPWTGREEHLGDGPEREFFMLCVTNDDPVTREHGFKIGWEDSSKKTRIYVPSFRHIKKPIIFDVGGFSDPDGLRRLSAIKEWCDQHSMTLLSLLQSSDGSTFDVVGWHKPKEKR